MFLFQESVPGLYILQDILRKIQGDDLTAATVKGFLQLVLQSLAQHGALAGVMLHDIITAPGVQIVVAAEEDPVAVFLEEGFPNLRKAHCMFGWDWGPRLPDAGIWRDISLIGIRTARIRDVYVRQYHTS